MPQNLSAAQENIQGYFGFIAKMNSNGTVQFDFSHHDGKMGLNDELKQRYLWMAKKAVETLEAYKPSGGIVQLADDRILSHMIPGPIRNG